MFQFRAKISGEIYGISKYLKTKADIEHTNECLIEYSLSFEVREHGIKHCYVDVTHFGCEISWSTYKDELNESQIVNLLKKGGVVNGELIEGKIEIIGSSKEWRLDCGLSFEGNSLAVNNVIVDFDEMSIEIF